MLSRAGAPVELSVLALERELTDGLSLRLASPIFGALYRWERVDEAGASSSDASGFSVQARLAPRLELRLAFQRPALPRRGVPGRRGQGARRAGQVPPPPSGGAPSIESGPPAE